MATFDVRAFIHKWYTFIPIGYNPENAKRSIRVMNRRGILYQFIWQGAHFSDPVAMGPSYFVRKEWSDKFSMTYERCEGVE